MAGRFDATVVVDRPIEEVTEISKNLVVAPEGGYDLAPAGEGKTQVTLFNVLEGRGLGKLIAPLALRSARRGAGEFGAAIKAAVEAASPRDAGPS